MSIIEEAKEYQQNFTGINHRADRVIRKLVTEYEKAYKQVVEAAKDFKKTLCIDVSIPAVPVIGKLAALVEALNQLSEVK